MRIKEPLLIVLCWLLVAGQTVKADNIHIAAADGDLETVKHLLSENPALLSAVDSQKSTPLHYAANNAHPELANYLLEQGADIEATDQRGNTPLLMAVQANNLEMVQLLVRNGAKATVQNSYGPAIEIAYWTECMKGTSGITEYLMSTGIPFDPNAEFLATRLNMASTFGNYEMAKFVVNLGADVNKVCTPDGMTEAHFAVECGHADIVGLLIAHGANLDVTNSDGYPPIWSAVNRGHAEIVTLLIDHNVPLDYIDPRHGRNLLLWAALRGQADIVEILLARGLNPNDTDKSGHEPLYYAGKYGHRAVAQLLVSAGAVPPDDLVENYGISPHLNETIPSGEAFGWGLQGRGWAIKTANHLLIFDSIQESFSKPTNPALANGFITTAEISDQNVYAIYSTFHWPIMEYVHQVEDSLSSVTYIHNKQESWRGCKNTVYVEPYQSLNLGELRLHAIQPAHFNPCLGYICEIDGIKIYCAAFAADDLEQFSRDLDSLQLSVGAMDIALVPLEIPNPGESRSIKVVLEKLKPKMICLSDYEHRSHFYPEIEKCVAALGLETTVFGPDNPGDNFRYRKTKNQAEY